MPRPNAIRSRIQVLVEGNDQRNFFEAVVDHLELEGVQIQNFGGVDELRPFVSDIAKSEEFADIVESLGIVRDAEVSAQSAFQSVQSSLQNAGLPVPAQPRVHAGDSSTVAVLILPDDNSPGMLESLLCRTFARALVNDCIDSFFECARAATGNELHRPEKARAHAYLSVQRDPHVSVGFAAQRGYWNLNHATLSGVHDFLRSL